MMAKTKSKRQRKTQVEPGSGNVFADLGLPNAEERLAKAELARVIRSVVAGKKWTQRRTADVLGVAPSDVSDLMRGKLARFSQERLERFLNALDLDVDIRVRPRAAGKRQASVTVEVLGL